MARSGKLAHPDAEHGFVETDFETILAQNPIPGQEQPAETPEPEPELTSTQPKRRRKPRKPAHHTPDPPSLKVEFDFGDGIVVPYTYRKAHLTDGAVRFLILEAREGDVAWSPPPTKRPITIRLESGSHTVWPTGSSFRAGDTVYLLFIVDPDADKKG